MSPLPDVAEAQLLRLLVRAIVILFVASVGLAAFVVVEHARRRAKDGKRREREGRWSAVLHDVLAGDAPPEMLQALVLPHERWHFAEFLTEFAVRLRGEELEAARQVARLTLPGIATHLAQGPASSRARHVRAMALLGGPNHAPQIVAALASPSSLVSATAARWLCRPEYSASAPDVIARLSRFSAWSPRFIGLLLARFGPGAAEPLRRLLESRAGEPERVGAARALWWMKDAEAADIAARLLGDGSLAPEVAESCLRLIERCGVERHSGAVRPWCPHPDPRVREAAFAALCVVGGQDDVARVVKGVGDPDVHVALQAAFALAREHRAEVSLLARSSEARTAAIAREALAT